MSSSAPHRVGRLRRRIAGIAGVVALSLGTSGCLLQILADGSERSAGLQEVVWTTPTGMPEEVRTEAELRQMA